MGQSSTTKIILSLALSGMVLAGCASTTEAPSASRSTSAVASSSSSSSATDTKSYLVENVGDRVFFATDQATLNGTSRATLRNQASWLSQNPGVRLTVEGHADERGTRDYNLALGARRANAVRDFLMSQGVSGDRLQTISYGKERPVSLCSEEACWSKNRRAVATIR